MKKYLIKKYLIKKYNYYITMEVVHFLLLFLIYVNSLSNQTLKDEIEPMLKSYFKESYKNLPRILRKDAVLVVIKDDPYYQIFKEVIPLKDDQALLVQVKDNKVITSVFNTLKSLEKVLNDKFIYFISSERAINIYNLLESKEINVHCNKTSTVLLENSKINNLVTNIKNKLQMFDNYQLTNDIFYLSVKTHKKSKIFTIKIKGLPEFKCTEIISDEKFIKELENDLEEIFRKNLLKSYSFDSEKMLFMDNYIIDVINYLYSHNYIYSKDTNKYHSLIPSLFSYSVCDLHSTRLNPYEMIKGGITFNTALNDDKLVNIINYNLFKEVVLFTDEIIFTKFSNYYWNIKSN